MLAAYVNELPLPVCQFYFQQDGAPVNFAGEVRWTDEILPGQWNGCREPTAWPQSPQISYP